MSSFLFLIPPSEGKLALGNEESESLSFQFKKPLSIIKKASEKDLKCKGKRYEEGITLNESIETGPFMKAIERYNGVMYKSVDFPSLSKKGNHYFQGHFLIFSGMYGLLSPLDSIGNYKLPIETKGLHEYWRKDITSWLKKQEGIHIVSFLPESYTKMIDKKFFKERCIQVQFLTSKNGKEVKMAHGSKKIKGEYIRNICEKAISDLNQLGEIIIDKNGYKTIQIYETEILR